MAPDPLTRIRLRLTAWYVVTFAGIFLLLGGGLLVALQRQFTEQLDGSLHEALQPVLRYAQQLPSEAAFRAAVVSGEFDALHGKERQVVFFAADGTPVGADSAALWIRNAAVVAAREGAAADQLDAGGDRTYRLRAERFSLGGGIAYVAAMMVDRDQTDDRYEALIATFGIAALVAVILIAGGGYVLVKKSLEPVDDSMRSMRRFMADAAHELQTPITVIRSRAEIAVQQPRDGASYVETLNGIARESERVGNIVGDLLTLARADAGERKIERLSFFLDDVVVDSASSVRVLAEAKGVTLEAERFEETAVIGDAGLVRQLTVILLHNAIKFTPCGGTVRFSVGVNGARPTLVVSDNGAGISSDHLPRVFERFYRAGETLAREGGTAGAGLGLSIARWIADAHEASIEIESAFKAGTIVTVQFPAA